MKKQFILLLTMVSIVAFSGCSKEKGDDNGGNNNGGGNIDGITTLPKRIATISSYGDNMTFTYDAQGRVIKIVNTATTDGEFISITYTADKVIIKDEESETNSYVLENKRAVSCNGVDWTSSFEYDKDGYMIKSSEVEIGYEDQPWICKYTWMDGLLTKITDDNESGIITYGTQPNNLNIDLFPLIEPDFLGDLITILGFGSKRSVKLPTKVSWNNGEYSESFSYETNKDGYITKITIVDDEKEGDTSLIAITYE